MNKKALLAPLQVRFTEPADVEQYGDGWFTYDELALVTTPARDLMRLEAELGVPLVDVMRGVRESSVLGDTAAAWVALRQSGADIAFEGFSPAIMLAEWRKAPEPAADEDPKDHGAVYLPTPEDLAAEAPEFLETAPDPTPIYSDTAPADTIVLPIMPVAESPSYSAFGPPYSPPA
jgi:hypothetical protein